MFQTVGDASMNDAAPTCGVSGKSVCGPMLLALAMRDKPLEPADPPTIRSAVAGDVDAIGEREEDETPPFAPPPASLTGSCSVSLFTSMTSGVAAGRSMKPRAAADEEAEPEAEELRVSMSGVGGEGPGSEGEGRPKCT